MLFWLWYPIYPSHSQSIAWPRDKNMCIPVLKHVTIQFLFLRALSQSAICLVITLWYPLSYMLFCPWYPRYPSHSQSIVWPRDKGSKTCISKSFFKHVTIQCKNVQYPNQRFVLWLPYGMLLHIYFVLSQSFPVINHHYSPLISINHR